MPDYVLQFFKGLSPAGHGSWLGLLVVFLLIDRFTASPDMTDRPLAHSEGRIVWVGVPKGGYDVELQPDESVRQYEKVLIRGERSTVVDRSLLEAGRMIRVDRYGDLVNSCWVGDKQVCVSRCTSDLHCKQMQAAFDSLLLPWEIGLTIFGYLFTLAWVACGGQIGLTPRKPRDDLKD
ncbi:hypothetical protein LZ023_12975 [Pseudomonas silvicola]|nr:hypothetical protein LZ023_12975 [Pseudomonas silvicola]